MLRCLRSACGAAICAAVLLGVRLDGAAPVPVVKPRVDAQGDPLPEGVVARLGSARLRHGDRVSGLAFLPDGSTLISSSDDGTLRAWQVPSGRELRRFEGHTGSVCRLALSANGKFLLSGGRDRTTRLWDAASGKQLRKFERHENGVIAVALAPNNAVVASGATDGTVRIWDLDNDQELLTLTAAEGYVSYMALAFSPDGKMLATGARDLRLWEMKTGKRLRQWQGHKDGHVFDLFFHDGGKQLVSGSHDGCVRIWNPATGEAIKEFGKKPDGGNFGLSDAVAITPDGKTLVSGNSDGKLFLYSIPDGDRPRILEGHRHWIRAFAFSPDGKLLASAGEDRTIRLWDWKAGKQLPEPATHQDMIQAVAVSPDGRKIATAANDSTVRIWDAASSQCLHVLEGHRHQLTAVDFSPDGKLLASSCYQDRAIRLWDVATGKLVQELQGGDRPVYHVRFSPDGKTLASAGDLIRLWDIATGREKGQLEGPARTGFTRVCWSPDGKLLAGGCYDRMIYLWQMPGRVEVQRFVGHERIVQGLAFAPDSKTLLSCGNDNRVRLWDAAKGEELWSSPTGEWDGTHGLNSIALSPDGKTLAVCGKPLKQGVPRVTLYDMAGRRKRAEALAVPGWFLCMAFTPDGKRLVLGSLDSTAIVLDVASVERLRNREPDR